MPGKLDETFAALGDPTRLAIVRLLRKKPLRSSEIADALDTHRPMASRHLRVLRASGLVEEIAVDDDGRGRRYRLRREPFSKVQAWLDEIEEFWGDQLGAFKAHLERKNERRR